MTVTNPYDPPGVPTPQVTHLARKSRRLLERRDEPITLMRYLTDQWRRHVLIAGTFALLCTAAWQIGNLYFLIGLGSCWAGRCSRDLQWYRTLVQEWSSTKELLDWEKIERLAK